MSSSKDSPLWPDRLQLFNEVAVNAMHASFDHVVQGELCVAEGLKIFDKCRAHTMLARLDERLQRKAGKPCCTHFAHELRCHAVHSELEELIHSKVRVSRSLQTTDEIGLDTVGSKFQQMFDGEIGQALAFQAFDKLDTDAVTLEFDQLVNREVCVAQATELSDIVTLGRSVCLLARRTVSALGLLSCVCILQICICVAGRNAYVDASHCFSLCLPVHTQSRNGSTQRRRTICLRELVNLASAADQPLSAAP